MRAGNGSGNFYDIDNYREAIASILKNGECMDADLYRNAITNIDFTDSSDEKKISRAFGNPDYNHPRILLQIRPGPAH